MWSDRSHLFFNPFFHPIKNGSLFFFQAPTKDLMLLFASYSFHVRLFHSYSWSYSGRDMAISLKLSLSAQIYPMPAKFAHINKDCLGSLLILINCVRCVLICFLSLLKLLSVYLHKKWEVPTFMYQNMKDRHFPLLRTILHTYITCQQLFSKFSKFFFQPKKAYHHIDHLDMFSSFLIFSSSIFLIRSTIS